MASVRIDPPPPQEVASSKQIGSSERDASLHMVGGDAISIKPDSDHVDVYESEDGSIDMYEPKKNMNLFFASLENRKKYGCHFLKLKKLKKHAFNFLQA